MVTRKRHFAKALTYRLLGSSATAVIAYVATGDVKLGASIGVLDSVAKIGFYYLHERLWYRIRWGVHHHEGPPPAGVPASLHGPSASSLPPTARASARAPEAAVLTHRNGEQLPGSPVAPPPPPTGSRTRTVP